MANVNIIEKTKVNWNTEPVNDAGYPGDTNMKIGCLQRIAAATEAMAKNYLQMQSDLGWYIKRSKDDAEEIRQLLRKNSALKGQITKLKKAKECQPSNPQ